MIQLKTMLNCIDNSGATIVECIANLRMKRHGRIGDRIIVVVQKSRSMGDGGPGSTSAAAANRVRRGDIRHAIIVRTAKKYQRKDGMVVKFEDNACALIGKNGEPLGTRINGIVGAELRSKQQSKILSLSSMHV
ncbi:50S ribosomal protein L14 [Usnea florida]